MTSPKIVLLSIVLVVSVSVNRCSGLKCYQCDDTNLKCKDRPFNSSAPGVTTCDTGLACYKMDTLENDAITATSRGCWPSSVGSWANCTTKTVNGIGQTNCTCYRDLCNGAPDTSCQFVIIPLLAFYGWFNM